jgi:hypothetical protein
MEDAEALNVLQWITPLQTEFDSQLTAQGILRIAQLRAVYELHQDPAFQQRWSQVEDNQSEINTASLAVKQNNYSRPYRPVVSMFDPTGAATSPPAKRSKSSVRGDMSVASTSSLPFGEIDKSIQHLRKKISASVSPALSAVATAVEKVDWWDKVEGDVLTIVARVHGGPDTLMLIVSDLVPGELLDEFKLRAGGMPLMPSVESQLKLLRLHLFQYELVEEESSTKFQQLVWIAGKPVAPFVLMFMKLAGRAQIPLKQVLARALYCFDSNAAVSSKIREWGLKGGAGHTLVEQMKTTSFHAPSHQAFATVLLEVLERVVRVHERREPGSGATNPINVSPTPLLVVPPLQPESYRSSDRRKPDLVRFEGECFYCKKTGHKQRECRFMASEQRKSALGQRKEAPRDSQGGRPSPKRVRFNNPTPVAQGSSSSDRRVVHKVLSQLKELDASGTEKVLALFNTSLEDLEASFDEE